MPLDKDLLARIRSNNPNLTALNLVGHQLNDTDIKELSDALNSNNTLKELNLSNNEIGPNGAKALSEALKSNNAITALDLGSNCIGNVGAKAFSEVIIINRTLIKLYLYSNLIDDNGAHDIHEALQHNTTLTIFDLTYNKISNYSAITSLITRNLENTLARRQVFIAVIILLTKIASTPKPDSSLWAKIPKDIRLHILSFLTFDTAYIGKTPQQINSFIKFIFANGDEGYKLRKYEKKIKIIEKKDVTKGNYYFQFFKPKSDFNSVEDLQLVAKNQHTNFSKD